MDAWHIWVWRSMASEILELDMKLFKGKHLILIMQFTEVSQQIGASMCSENFSVHDVLIWNHFVFTICSIAT